MHAVNRAGMVHRFEIAVPHNSRIWFLISSCGINHQRLDFDQLCVYRKSYCFAYLHLLECMFVS